MDVEPMYFVISCILAEGKFTDTISTHAYSTNLPSKKFQKTKKPNSSYYALSVIYFTHYKSNLKKKPHFGGSKWENIKFKCSGFGQEVTTHTKRIL